MRILWVKTEFLHPVDKGGKIRTYYMLRELLQRHEITYLALDDTRSDDAINRSTEYCHDLVCVPHRTSKKFTYRFYLELVRNLASGVPYAIQKYVEPRMSERIRELVPSKQIDLLVCDFLAPSINVPQNMACATLLFQHNVEAMIWRRHFERADSFVKRLYLREQWRRMVKFEQNQCQRYDRVVAVSPKDQRVFHEEYGIENVECVPTGVDTQYFRPRRPERRSGNLIFTGSMDWLPNDDGIRFFIEEVLPLIRSKEPGVTLTVVGRDPRPWLRNLSHRASGVIVTGRVDDVRPYMDDAAVFIVPLRVAGGTRLKLFEAMAMEMPIVSTSIGAEGLPVKNGKELLISDSPELFASSVLRLLAHPAEAEILASRAAARVRRDFAWGGVVAHFETICDKALREHRDRRGAERQEDFLSENPHCGVLHEERRTRATPEIRKN